MFKILEVISDYKICNFANICQVLITPLIKADVSLTGLNPYSVKHFTSPKQNCTSKVFLSTIICQMVSGELCRVNAFKWFISHDPINT